MNFNVTLGSTEHDRVFQLQYEPYKHSVAEKYFALVEKFLSRGREIDPDNSYWYFNLLPRQKQKMVEELQRHLDTLKIEPQIKMDYRVSIDISQELLNEIHDKFEMYLNAVNSEAIAVVQPDVIISALLQINLSIHKIENYNDIQRVIAKGGWEPVFANFGYCFRRDERFELEEFDYDHFRAGSQFGEMFCGYNTTGKNFQHIQRDGDFELIRSGKVRPQRTFSTEAFFWFGQPSNEEVILNQFYKWWDENKISSFGYRKYDRKNGIGLIPLARLIMPESLIGLSHKERLLALNEFNCIKQVSFVETETETETEPVAKDPVHQRQEVVVL